MHPCFLTEERENDMELKLELEEVELLKRILTNFVSDLKMEITNTENYDWREDMKHDEAMIRSLIDRLERGA